MSARDPLGRCVCGAAVHGNGFRDRGSYRAFYQTGLCQACQDEVFLCSTGDAQSPVPLRRGVIAAVSTGEVCFFPFVFVAPEPRIAWEARFIVRAGSAGSGLDPIDPYDELAPMAEQLAEHQVQISEVAASRARLAFEGPAGIDLLIAPDRSTLVTVAPACSGGDDARCVALDAAYPWQAAFGRPFHPVASWWEPGAEECSALRICAVMALLLVDPAGCDSGCLRPFDHVLSSCAQLFAEVAEPGSRIAPVRHSTQEQFPWKH